MRRKLVLAAALAIAFLSGGAIASQIVAVEPVTPRVLSGPDVGFRVEGLRDATPVGTLVVRINGEWVAAELGTVNARIYPR